MNAFLEVWRSGGAELVQLGDERITVGRSDGNTIVLSDDSQVSRVHAVVEQLAGSWSVRDVNSRNGTFLNGSRVSGEARLSAGDELRIGRTRIVLRADRTADDPGMTEAQAAPPTLTPRERDVLIALFTPLTGSEMFSEPASTGRSRRRCGSARPRSSSTCCGSTTSSASPARASAGAPGWPTRRCAAAPSRWPRSAPRPPPRPNDPGRGSRQGPAAPAAGPCRFPPPRRQPVPTDRSPLVVRTVIVERAPGSLRTSTSVSPADGGRPHPVRAGVGQHDPHVPADRLRLQRHRALHGAHLDVTADRVDDRGGRAVLVDQDRAAGAARGQRAGEAGRGQVAAGAADRDRRAPRDRDLVVDAARPARRVDLRALGLDVQQVALVADGLDRGVGLAVDAAGDGDGRVVGADAR